MLDVARSCQVCHRQDEAELVRRVETIQDRTRMLMDLAKNAVIELLHDIAAAETAGAPAEVLEAARRQHRRAQWRLDFVNAENSMGFHASQEAARILGASIDEARKGQVRVLRR